MTFKQSLLAVFSGERPEQVPFCPYDNLAPRGALERELRNRGMGLCARRRTVRSETPGVTTEVRAFGEVQRTTVRTPRGELTSERRFKYDRRDVGSVQTSWLIRERADFDAAIALVEDTVFYPHYEAFLDAERDYGEDGIVRGDGVAAPYDESVGFFGLENWVYAQHDHPAELERLLDALLARARRKVIVEVESPARFVGCGSISGNYGPRELERYLVPFYEEFMPLFRAKGIVTSVHAHASNNASYIELIPRLGVDVVEAFTPPPVGNLSVAEARKAWGEGVVIWVNFPETVFYEGPEKTREYVRDLVRQDPARRLVIGMTEMGTLGVVDSETERIFTSGMRAIMDAVEEAS